MASKILSFICHVPGLTPDAYPSMPASKPAAQSVVRRFASSANTPSMHSTASGHFAAIYENERFVRFKYINEVAVR